MLLGHASFYLPVEQECIQTLDWGEAAVVMLRVELGSFIQVCHGLVVYRLTVVKIALDLVLVIDLTKVF